MAGLVNAAKATGSAPAGLGLERLNATSFANTTRASFMEGRYPCTSYFLGWGEGLYLA